MPKTTGSTSAGAVWLRLVQTGIAPKAVLFSQPIDSLAAAGLVVADVWGDQRIVVVDQLGNAFLDLVESGDWITVEEDGTVIMIKASHAFINMTHAK